MVFGKRVLSEKDKRINIDRLNGHAGRWGITAGDLGLAAGAAIVVFLGTYFFAGDYIGGWASTQANLPQARFSGEPQAVARAYDKMGPIPFLVPTGFMVALKMNETPEGFDAIDSELHERCLKPIDKTAAEYAEKRGETFLHTERAAEFLACSMNIYHSRFCETRYKERLVTRLKEFVRARRAHFAALEKIRNSRSGRMMIEVARVSSGKDGDIASGYRPSEFIPGLLGKRILSLSEASMLSQRDFGGWFGEPPEELKPYLKTESIQSPCG